MTALVWDQPGNRRFETGLDRGVLFFPGGVVPWNGLTSINESTDREIKSYHLDGIKYLDHYVPGSYVAKLEAYTYPDELDELIGNASYAPGVILHDQRAKLFNLSYRTKIGNDLESLDYGYKLHILYNILATPGSVTLNSTADTTNATPFSWNLSGTPATMFGIRPTSHISLDSRLIDESLLDAIEEMIYGTEEVDPVLPNLVDLLALVPS